jgi:hypothetical protein
VAEESEVDSVLDEPLSLHEIMKAVIAAIAIIFFIFNFFRFKI